VVKSQKCVAHTQVKNKQSLTVSSGGGKRVNWRTRYVRWRRLKSQGRQAGKHYLRCSEGQLNWKSNRRLELQPGRQATSPTPGSTCVNKAATLTSIHLPLREKEREGRRAGHITSWLMFWLWLIVTYQSRPCRRREQWIYIRLLLLLIILSNNLMQHEYIFVCVCLYAYGWECY